MLMNQPVQALSLTSAVNNWWANSRHPRILHLFDHACNLINERGEVFSVVTPQIGNGPFNLVIETNDLFSELLSLESPISISPTHLTIGSLSIHTAGAELWEPRPDWQLLHSRKDDITTQLLKLPVANDPFSHSLVSNLSATLATTDTSTAKTIASQLAGLGNGLTPSGDDFIMGALYAAWIMHPPDIACTLVQKVAETAAPLTTSLSAAWLRSAGRGEAGILWHDFFKVLLSENAVKIQTAMEQILVVGATSGADALSGFIQTFLHDRVKTSHG
jgi:hypothetical protein